MNTIFHIYIIGIILLVIGGIIYLFLRHQRNLKSRAFLMQEAIRNGDYSFRLSTKGLLFGERALQQALNDMENDIGRLVAQHEVESWQRLTRVLTHEIMNATAPISSICQAYLSNPDIQGSSYEEGIRAIRDTSKSLTSFCGQLPQTHPATKSCHREHSTQGFRGRHQAALSSDRMAHPYPRRCHLVCRQEHAAPGIYQSDQECHRGSRLSHRHSMLPQTSREHREFTILRHLFQQQWRPHPCRCGKGDVHPLLLHQAIRFGHRPLHLPPDADDAIHQSLPCRAQCGRLSCNIPDGMKYIIKKMKQKLLVVSRLLCTFASETYK